MVCPLLWAVFLCRPSAQRPDKLRAQAVYAVLTGKEVPGLHRPLQKFRRMPVPRDHLRKGQGKFIGNAHLHQEFHKVAVPLYHHAAFQIPRKGLRNLLLQLWTRAQALQHLKGGMAHDICVAPASLRYKFQLLFCNVQSPGLHVSDGLFFLKPQIILCDDE